MGQIRQDCFEALATIPDEIETAKLSVDIHRGLEPSARLHNSTSKLYIKILETLQHIMNWFGQHSGSTSVIRSKLIGTTSNKL